MTIKAAVAIAVEGGFVVQDVAETGSVYLTKEGFKRLRIGGHSRCLPRKSQRRRTVSINVSDKYWPQKLAAFMNGKYLSSREIYGGQQAQGGNEEEVEVERPRLTRRPRTTKDLQMQTEVEKPEPCGRRVEPLVRLLTERVEHYESETVAFCSCGEQINIVRGSDLTRRSDGVRLRYPDDQDGWCVFRCRSCGEVADPLER